MILRLKSITKTFKTIKALNNFNYEFFNGNIYGIVGPNGAGKTTLVKIICGLLIPDQGNVFFNDSPLYPEGLHNLKRVGAILEGSRNIFWNFTPLQNVKYFSYLRGIPVKSSIKKAMDIFKEFGLSDKLNTPVRNLSQGMKQKIAITISILHDPEILLLDEPTLGLDPIAGNKMQEYILMFARENKKIVIITSHQLSILENICDRIIFLKKGNFIADHDIKEIKLNSKKTKYIIKTVNKTGAQNDIPQNILTKIEDDSEFSIFQFIPHKITLQECLEILQKCGYEIVDIEKITPSLEDFFIEEFSQ